MLVHCTVLTVIQDKLILNAYPIMTVHSINFYSVSDTYDLVMCTVILDVEVVISIYVLFF